MSSLERLVFDALPIILYTVDLDDRITSVNPAWSRFARANSAQRHSEPADILGASIWDSIVDASAREDVVAAMRALREGRPGTLSWESHRSSPTEEGIFLMQVSALRDGPALVGFVFSGVDITPSHRAAAVLIDTGMALARTISVGRALAEVSLQLRRSLVADGVAIALANDDTAELQLAHVSGMSEESAALVSRLAPVWLEALATGEVVTTATADDGLELTAPMTSSEGVIGAITLSLSRATRSTRMAELRRVLATISAETAAAIDRAWLVERVGHKRRLEAIGEVSAGVAHELRNPLFGISSAAQLLRFRVSNDPVVEKNVGRILREVERLNSMVTALLEFGRPHPIDLAPVDPDRLWDEVIESQRGLLESRGLTLRRTRAVPATSCALDAPQFSQVLLNLLLNAAQAAPHGGEITLATTVSVGGGWRSRLHNGGAAIPSEDLPRVFEMFFSTRTGGTGIGLALCQRIVDEHGGTISLDSSPAQGTSATVTIPVTPVA